FLARGAAGGRRTGDAVHLRILTDSHRRSIAGRDERAVTETTASAAGTPNLGRLLEISLFVEQPAEASATFRSLGLREVPVADFGPCPRAVVSDGRLAIGLYDTALDGP